MSYPRATYVRTSRLGAVLAVLVAFLVAFGAPSTAQTPEAEQETDASSSSTVLSLRWPNGVDLLAAQNISLPTGEYYWRVSTLTATASVSDPIETERGIVVAVSGRMMVQVNGASVVQLNRGSATTVPEDGELVVARNGDEDVDYLLIEVIPDADIDQDAEPEEGVQVVGPVTVAGGGYGMVLLDVPIAVTIDMPVDEVIAGSLRPAVSIAHDDNGIPETLDPNRKYDRWIAALFPIGDVVITDTTPTPPPARPQSPPVNNPAPPPAPAPTATTAPTATAEPTATEVPTVAPTEVPATEVPTAIPATEVPTAIPATEIPTAIPATEVPTVEVTSQA